MHIKWSRNLDGIRRQSSFEGPCDVQETPDFLAFRAKLAENNQNFLSPLQRRDNRKSTVIITSPIMTKKVPHVVSPNCSSHIPNRISSKGALSTLISLFAFKPEMTPSSSSSHHKNRRMHARRRYSLERTTGSLRITKSSQTSVAQESRLRRANSLLSLEDSMHKSSLVRFEDDEPVKAEDIEVKPLQGILRMSRVSTDSSGSGSDSFDGSLESRSSSSASSSQTSNNSAKRVHFAHPLSTFSWIVGT